MLLKHVLRSLTLIYANDYRSSTTDWDHSLAEVLPIRVSTPHSFSADKEVNYMQLSAAGPQ